MISSLTTIKAVLVAVACSIAFASSSYADKKFEFKEFKVKDLKKKDFEFENLLNQFTKIELQEPRILNVLDGKSCAVPDGGSTLVMLGSALLVFVGIGNRLRSVK